MSSTGGEVSVTTLRLASARRRVRAFLDQIHQLLASDFPHADGEEALKVIREDFEYRLEHVLQDLPAGTKESVVDSICADTSLTVAQYTAVLGFILRSTNVRNAFEVHFPLKRLVQQVIDPNARLIMSSEWNFVPFTYPMTLDLLPGFVLVGAPAPESSNVLLVPLAGHEIGHSAWRKHDIGRHIQQKLSNAVDASMAAKPGLRDQLLNNLAKTGQGLPQLQDACMFSASKQLEEIFCDLFGFYIFGESYVYAYEYFLAPGGKLRSAAYPSSKERVRYLIEGAYSLGLKIDPDLFARWLDSTPRYGLTMDALALADDSVAAMFGEIRTIVFNLLKGAGVLLNRPDAIDRVTSAFRRHIPDGDGATLYEIVTAGWRYLRAAGGLSHDTNQEEYNMLGELMLKSIEVSEFLLRVEPHA